LSKIERIDADEAIKRRGEFGTDNTELLKRIEKTQDDRFKDIYSLRFGWRKQPSEDPTKEAEIKLMSLLPNGKIVFVDRSHDEKDIIPEDPYICLVYERPREAFAKILFPEYQPKIYITPSRIPAMVWRDSKGRVNRKHPDGNSYEERIIAAIREMEMLGFESVKLVFRKNMRGDQLNAPSV